MMRANSEVGLPSGMPSGSPFAAIPVQNGTTVS
jgi:hypothetical protein